MIQPPFVILISQPGVVTGSIQIFVAASNGSPGSCEVVVVGVGKGRDGVCAGQRRPRVAEHRFAVGVCRRDPLVMTEPVTVKRTVTPGCGTPTALVTVAVTQCCVSTGFVAVAGSSVSVVAGPPEHGVPPAPVGAEWHEVDALLPIDAVAASGTVRRSRDRRPLPTSSCVASIISRPEGYRAPMAFPTMLFWFASLVEIVPGNCVALKKMPAPACVKPFPVKQLSVIVLFCAPLAGSGRVAEAGQRQAVTAVAVESVLLDAVFFGPPCRPSKTLLLNVLPVIGPSPQALLPRFTPVWLRSMKFPLNSGVRAPAVLVVHVAVPVDEESRWPVSPLTTRLLVNQSPSKLSVIEMKEIAAADLGRAVDVVLIDGDVDPVVVEKHTVTRESLDAVVQDLQPVMGPVVDSMPRFRRRR